MVRSHGLPPDRMQSVVDRYREEDLPRIESASGFVGLALGAHADTGSVGAVTFWESEQAMLASDKLSEEARERARPFHQAQDPMLVDHFEVVLLRQGEPLSDAPDPHMRLVRFTGLTPESVTQASDSYRADIRRYLGETRGVCAVAVGVHPGAGSFAVVTFWETERDMSESTQVSDAARGHAIEATRTTLTPLVDCYKIGVASHLERIGTVESQTVPG
jgi:heme-degrading monooxygenase HmoA